MTNDSTLTLREQLEGLAEENYRRFSVSLLPGTDNILGVRLPVLRKLAKKIAKDDWKTAIQNLSHDTFEETMLHGMILGYIKTELKERLHYIADFVPYINNWSVCDSFCIGLKFTIEHRACVWEFLQPYFISMKEFDIRFGVVMLLDFFIEPDYINRILPLLDSIKHSGYYAKTAVAWAISMCFVKFPDLTMDYLHHNTLDDETYHKALSKITESLQVDNATKQKIRAMKRKSPAKT